MGSLAGKSPANTYKSLLKVADETNGVTGTLSNVEDGEGTSSSLNVSNSQTRINPSANTTATFRVNTADNTNLFIVDTNNSLVKVGTSQVSATTQLLYFKGYRVKPSAAGTHTFISLGNAEYGNSAIAEVSGGTGTDPDTSIDSGAATDDLLLCIFAVPYNVTIDACKALISSLNSTDVVCNVHLMSYDMVNDGTTNDGNLSNGTVLADGQATAVDRNVIKTLDMTIQSSSVTSGKIIACLVENETNTDDITISVQVKYHIA
jgi:hypothetical protein